MMEVLVTQFHVDESRMGIVGLADKEPEADDDTPEGRAKNRRVDVIIANRLARAPKQDKAATKQPQKKSAKLTRCDQHVEQGRSSAWTLPPVRRPASVVCS